MRSRASYQGHPLHPALIPFPFAFLIGAAVFDAAAWLLDRPDWWATGGHLALAGVATALLAAVPGLIDYRYTVPPRSTGKQRARRHMIVNLTAVALVAGAWFARMDATPAGGVLLAELAALALLTAGGWMGGVLVSRNQISVDHRYAGAGKWKEQTVTGRPGASVVVAAADELQVNQMKLIRAGDRRIVVARTEEGHVAFDDRCTHRGGSLAGGVLICGTVQCPWHGSQFNVRTGAVSAGPAEDGIETWPLEVRGHDVLLTLPR